MLITEIARRVKIVTLKTGAWRPTRLHKRETAAENARHGTVDQARVSVRVCDHPALAKLATIHKECYQEHIRITRPTVQDGMRLLPLTLELEYGKKLGDFASRHQGLTAEFLAAYDSEKASAPARLNGLYDSSFWPSIEKVEKKFRLEVQYLPCPIDGEWKDWLSVSVHMAQDELREQLGDAIKRIAERCASDGKLYQSVFSNLADILALVPDLDLAGDPLIRSIAQQAQLLADQDKDAVASSQNKRRAIAQEATRLAVMFGALCLQKQPVGSASAH